MPMTFKSFPIGRQVWLRQLSAWVPATVHAIEHGGVTVRTADGRTAGVHSSVLRRDLRVVPHSVGLRRRPRGL